MFKHVLLGVSVLIWLAAGICLAADFSQPERDIEFLKATKRQDAKMNTYFGDMLPGDISFGHYGSFRVMVTRYNIERRVTLVPIKVAPYGSLDELKASVWGDHLPIGYLDLPYANIDPTIAPGSYIIEFDGLKVHLVDYEGYEQASFLAKIELPDENSPISEEQDSLATSKFGLAYIDPSDELMLYVQFSDPNGKPVSDEHGYSKAVVRFTIPGLTEDETSDTLVKNGAEKEEQAATDVEQ